MTKEIDLVLLVLVQLTLNLVLYLYFGPVKMFSYKPCTLVDSP